MGCIEVVEVVILFGRGNGLNLGDGELEGEGKILMEADNGRL